MWAEDSSQCQAYFGPNESYYYNCRDGKDQNGYIDIYPPTSHSNSNFPNGNCHFIMDPNTNRHVDAHFYDQTFRKIKVCSEFSQKSELPTPLFMGHYTG